MWQRLTDGTLFKKEVAAEQGDDGAGVEDPEAEAVPLIGGEAVEDSDAGEELLAEDGAMMELAEAAPADVDEGPLALASRGLSAAAVVFEIRTGIEKAERCGFLAVIHGRYTPLFGRAQIRLASHRELNKT